MNAVYLIMLTGVLVSCSRWDVEPKTIKAADYKRGQVSIRRFYSCDLDEGKELFGGGGKTSDFAVDQFTITGRGSVLSLVPFNGATYSLTDLNKLGIKIESIPDLYPSLLKLKYQTMGLSAVLGRPSISDPSKEFQIGSIVAYRTSEGQYGVFQLDKFDSGQILLTWLTFTK